MQHINTVEISNAELMNGNPGDNQVMFHHRYLSHAFGGGQADSDRPVNPITAHNKSP